MLIPAEADLIRELTTLREEGLLRLRQIDLPALLSAARLVTRDEASPGHVVIEVLLRRATSRLGGGQFGDAAVALLSLDAGTRGLSSKARREIAAQALERTYETFRKNYEPLILEQLAVQILVLCSEQQTRNARETANPADSPQVSAMAQTWIERFAAYYRIWSPISGLAGDLTAYRSTLLEPNEVWDRRFGTDAPDDPGYSREEQAEGYATFALYHYARFEWELRQFETLFGGHWLLSDAEAEQALADAVYRIRWHARWNERDQSFLRTLVAEAPDQELHPFIQFLRSSEAGRITEQEWNEWTDACRCSWPPGLSSDNEYFPTSRFHATISSACEVHNLVQACCDYLELVDQDWRRVADWYHLPAAQRRGISPEQLYAELRSPRDAETQDTRTLPNEP